MGLATIIVCIDGSEVARRAAVSGLAILRPAERVLVATVVEEPDEMAVTGTGFAGGVMSSDELAEVDRARYREGQMLAEQTVGLLAPLSAEVRVLPGKPGPTVCDLAVQLSAEALVMGSRGRGRVKQALLGSVSSYVLRSAPCPVVVSGPGDLG
jgi:nucleotide-binding universal stress UspA family protein